MLQEVEERLQLGDDVNKRFAFGRFALQTACSALDKKVSAYIVFTIFSKLLSFSLRD